MKPKLSIIIEVSQDLSRHFSAPLFCR